MKLIKDIYSKRAICIFPIESEKRRQAIDEIPYPMKSETNSKCGMNLEPRAVSTSVAVKHMLGNALIAAWHWRN